MKYTFVYVLVLLVGTSCYHNPQERNTIILKDSVDEVENAMSQMTQLMRLLPDPDDGTNKTYIVGKDFFHVNNVDFNDPEKLIGTDSDVFSAFTQRQKQEFVLLVLFLERNFITSCSKLYKRDSYVFGYRELDDVGFNDARDLTLAKNGLGESALIGEFQILDRKSDILLLAPSSAEIR